MIVLGAAIYTAGTVALALHAVRAEEYRFAPLALVWPIGVPVGIAMVAWAKATPWVRRRGPNGGGPLGE